MLNFQFHNLQLKAQYRFANRFLYFNKLITKSFLSLLFATTDKMHPNKIIRVVASKKG